MSLMQTSQEKCRRKRRNGRSIGPAADRAEEGQEPRAKINGHRRIATPKGEWRGLTCTCEKLLRRQMRLLFLDLVLRLLQFIGRSLGASGQPVVRVDLSVGVVGRLIELREIGAAGHQA